MNEVVFFSLALLIFIRLIGVIVSIDFYLRIGHIRFSIFIVGWILWFLAGIFPFFADITDNILLSNIFLIINGLLAALGTLAIYLGIIYNFGYIQFKIIVAISILVVISSIIFAILIDTRIAISFSFIITELSLVSLILLHILKGKSFVQYLGKSIIWYYITVSFGFIIIAISIINFLQGYSFGLYNSTDYVAIFVNYFFGISITFLTLIFFTYFEYRILNREKLKLKDIFSHNLGNILQSILTATEVNRLEKNEDLIDLIEKKSKEAAELINKIKKI